MYIYAHTLVCVFLFNIMLCMNMVVLSEDVHITIRRKYEHLVSKLRSGMEPFRFTLAAMGTFGVDLSCMLYVSTLDCQAGHQSMMTI